MPLGMTWNGAGAWLIFSQSRQVNFSRTVSITFHWRGSHLQRSGHVLAEFAQTVSATAFASRRRIDHHALAGKVVGECVALGTLARERGARGRFGDGRFRRKFVFGRVRLQVCIRRRPQAVCFRPPRLSGDPANVARTTVWARAGGDGRRL